MKQERADKSGIRESLAKLISGDDDEDTPKPRQRPGTAVAPPQPAEMRDCGAQPPRKLPGDQ